MTPPPPARAARRASAPRFPTPAPAPPPIALIVGVVLALLLAGGLALPRGPLDPVGHAAAYASTGVSPAPLAFAAGAYDAADGYALMFGGQDPSQAPTASTWTFSNANWTDLTSSVGAPPPARWGAGIAFDAHDGYVVLFGGCANAGCTSVLNDTWAYAHGRWTNLTDRMAPTPSARGQPAMTYDGATGEVVLFGGADAGGDPLGDTWTFAGGRWTAVPSSPTTVEPVARVGSAMAYFPYLGSVLFGGRTASGIAGDTWRFNGTNWSTIPVTGATPAPRWDASMTFDAVDGYVVLQGGYNAGTYDGDLWTFGGSAWTALAPTQASPTTYGALLVYDAADGYSVCFSGITHGSYLTSTFLLVHGQWVLLINPPGSGSTASLFLAFLPLILVFGTMPVAILLGNRSRRRREARLSSTFALGPGEVLQWIPSPPTLSMTRRVLTLTGGIFAAILVPTLIFVGVVGGGWGAVEFIGGFTGGLMALVVGLGAWGGRRAENRAIAVTAAGVIVDRRQGELRLPWDTLQPGISRPEKGRYQFRYADPTNAQVQGGFIVSVDQARAILAHPSAPAWVLPPAVAQALGLPVQKGGPAGSTAYARTRILPGPSAPGPLADPGDAPLAGGSVSAGAPASRSRAFPTSSTVYYAEPGPPPVVPAPRPMRSPAPPVPPPPPPAPPPGTAPGAALAPLPPFLRCLRCGHINPAGQVVFCQQCGQRLA
jgi:Galactose oxidase, central domain